MSTPKRHWRQFPSIYADLILAAAQGLPAEVTGITERDAFNLRVELYRFRDALFDDPERTPGSEADEMHKIAINYVTEAHKEAGGTVTLRLKLHPLVAAQREGRLVFGKQEAPASLKASPAGDTDDDRYYDLSTGKPS